MTMSTIMTTSTTSNSKADLPNHIHVFKVDQHEDYKSLLLSSVENMISTNNIQPNEKGYYYDFNIPKAPRTYQPLVETLLYPYAMEIAELYGLKIQRGRGQIHDGSSELHTFPNMWWFQQYKQGSDFGWHQHSGHWALVYYLELPEMSESTEFLNYDNISVEEGDVIFFPTFLVHRSPIITSNMRKTIIATNIEFTVDREMIDLYGRQSFKH